MFKLFLLKIIFLEEFVFIKKIVFKNTYVQGILCRYTFGCVLVGPMTDGGQSDYSGAQNIGNI